jgi:hypothetical protein
VLLTQADIRQVSTESQAAELIERLRDSIVIMDLDVLKLLKMRQILGVSAAQSVLEVLWNRGLTVDEIHRVSQQTNLIIGMREGGLYRMRWVPSGRVQVGFRNGR